MNIIIQLNYATFLFNKINKREKYPIAKLNSPAFDLFNII